jgi:hypothetical protein
MIVRREHPHGEVRATPLRTAIGIPRIFFGCRRTVCRPMYSR